VTHWARDRARGPKLSMEYAVKKQTADVAELWGLHDRGVLAAGKKADLSITGVRALGMIAKNKLPYGPKSWPGEDGTWCPVGPEADFPRWEKNTKKADLNVFDARGLRIRMPHYERDLPMRAGRWLQEVDGYNLTLVAGRETFRDGVPTGELPGRLSAPCRTPPVPESGFDSDIYSLSHLLHHLLSLQSRG